jgi:hypothetical protein
MLLLLLLLLLLLFRLPLRRLSLQGQLAWQLGQACHLTSGHTTEHDKVGHPSSVPVLGRIRVRPPGR